MRQGSKEMYPSRNFIANQALAGKGLQLQIGQRGAHMQHHCAGHVLAQAGVGDSKGGPRFDGWVPAQHQVNLGGDYLLPATIDDLFEAARKGKGSPGVEAAQIASAKPGIGSRPEAEGQKASRLASSSFQ